MSAPSAAPGREPTRRGRTGTAPHGSWWSWAFVAPALAGLFLFYLWPILQTGYFSFTEWGIFGGSEWVGGDNYERLVADGAVTRSIINTFAYTAVVLCGVPLAVIFASLINRPGLRFAQLYRTLYFMPYVAMPVAVALVWRLIFHGDFGVVNAALAVFGIDGPHWTSTPNVALLALGVVGLWMSIGFNMIILSAGLKAIPAEVYEAAQVDGAGGIRTFFSITVPLLGPSIFFVTVITTINGLQLFDLLFAFLGANNPAMAETQSIVYLFYAEAFIYNNKGYGAAIALLILVIIGAVTALQFRLQKRWSDNV